MRLAAQSAYKRAATCLCACVCGCLFQFVFVCGLLASLPSSLILLGFGLVLVLSDVFVMYGCFCLIVGIVGMFNVRRVLVPTFLMKALCMYLCL